MVRPYLLLTKIIWQIGDHDLVLACDAVLWRSTLLTSLRSVGLAGLGSIQVQATFLSGLSSERFVCGLRERRDLAWHVCWSSTVRRRFDLAVGGLCALY